MGDYFPILAICNGFEMMGIYIADDPEILSSDLQDDKVNHILISTPLTWSNRLFSKLIYDEFDAIFNEELCYFHHKNGFHFDDWVMND